MRITHESRSLTYRSPYGAVPVSETVRLAVLVEPDPELQDSPGEQAGEAAADVHLCYAYGLYEFFESRSRMLPDASVAGLYVTTLTMPGDPGLLFYWFEIETHAGTTFLTADRASLAGGGECSLVPPRYLAGEAHHPLAFRITVHERGISVPDWFQGALAYQIFPDRFARDRSFSPLRFARGPERPERIFHAAWSDDVDYSGRPETGYLACDFYGGSLAGIRERLDYLAGLGIDVLYLNPIFLARSSHRYDTGDYEQVDPLLGTADDFRELCGSARERGIRIILDGVFNHTGADSRYFNKYRRFPGCGAYQEVTGQGHSPYRSWYRFNLEDGNLFYDAWWGFQELPTVNEQDLSYQEYMLGPDGIVRHWLRLGASGWRLDVSDELPDSFLRRLYRAAKAEKPDAVVLGEVWEDASAKISYDAYRDYLFGRTHDSMMGYPFRQAVLGFLAGSQPAESMLLELETLREHYPLPYLYSNLNLIGSHDVPRAITVLAGLPDPGTREAQARIRLSAEARIRGERLLLLLFLFLFGYPGTPCIYYGDEAGLEGYRDPFNRRTFPWGRENGPLTAQVRRLSLMRRRLPVLRVGCYRPLTASCGLFVFERTLPGGRDFLGRLADGPHRAVIVINRDSRPACWSEQGREYHVPGMNGGLIFDGRLELAWPDD